MSLALNRTLSLLSVILTITDFGIVGKNDLYAQQSLISANRYAEYAMQAFEEDYNISEQYHHLLDGKWPQ